MGPPPFTRGVRGWVSISQKVNLEGLYGMVSHSGVCPGGPYIINTVDSHGLKDHNLWGTIMA